MLLCTELKNWEVEEIRDINGLEFSVALKFKRIKLHRNHTYIFPLASESRENEIWQVGDDEFVIFNNPVLCHISLSPEAGVTTLYRTPAIRPGSIFGNNGKKFFRFEDSSYSTHIYFVSDRDELHALIRKIIDPAAQVVVEEAPHSLMVAVTVHGLTHRFPFNLLLESREDLTCAFGGTFVYEAIKRCEEIKIAEYYEKCGGYYMGNGVLAEGIFTENDGRYEFSPDDFFRNVATGKLLAANNLMPGLPGNSCVFWRKEVDDEDFSISLSHDILLINEKKSGKTYGLEMYGERCTGVMRIGENEFLALTEQPYDSDNIVASVRHLADCPTRLRYFGRLNVGKFSWGIWPDPHAIIRPDRCQINDDTIVFTTDTDYNAFSSFKMLSISKEKLVNPVDGSDAIKKLAKDPYIYHMERQIMVKYRNHPQWKAWPMIVLRIYVPKEYCDIFALIDPSKKYRVYGKVYNMLANSMVEGPKTAHGLVKMFKENCALKLKYSL